MPPAIAEQELFRACEIIFGPELIVTREFLDYLQPSGIKSAYRKRALETHPDRFVGQDPLVRQRCSELFHSVHEAYERLSAFLKARERGFRLPPSQQSPPKNGRSRPTPGPGNARPRPEPRQHRRQAGATTAAGRHGNNSRPKEKPARSRGQSFWDIESLYQGPLPRRRLLLGHFLYYSGVASWRTIVQALIWQRGQRPRLGEIALRFGMLHEEDIRLILTRKEFLHPFGESAVAMGLLSPRQLDMLLRQQKRLQKRIGAYFLEKKLLHPLQFEQLLQRYHQHNASLARKAGEGRFRS